MSISFNVIERGQPGVVGGGEKKFYANHRYSRRNQSLKVLLKKLKKSVRSAGLIYGL